MLHLLHRTVVAAVIATIGCLSLTVAPARADSVCTTAFETTLKLHSYRTTIKNEHGVTTVDIVLPNRAHLVGTGTEMIVIGSSTWLRTADGWKPQTMRIDMSAMFAKARQKLEESRNDGSCRFSGMGFYNGQPARILTFAHKGPNGTSAGKAYLLGDGYIHRIDLAGPPATSTDFSEFNSASVNPP